MISDEIFEYITVEEFERLLNGEFLKEMFPGDTENDEL